MFVKLELVMTSRWEAYRESPMSPELFGAFVKGPATFIMIVSQDKCWNRV